MFSLVIFCYLLFIHSYSFPDPDFKALHSRSYLTQSCICRFLYHALNHSLPHARMHASIAQTITSRFFHWTPSLRGIPLSGTTHFCDHAITYHISLYIGERLAHQSLIQSDSSMHWCTPSTDNQSVLDCIESCITFEEG